LALRSTAARALPGLPGAPPSTSSRGSASGVSEAWKWLGKMCGKSPEIHMCIYICIFIYIYICIYIYIHIIHIFIFRPPINQAFAVEIMIHFAWRCASPRPMASFWWATPPGDLGLAD
jgi:hypothetical protein